MRKLGSMVAELALDTKKYNTGTQSAIRQTKALNTHLTKTSSVMGKVAKAAIAMGIALGTARLTRTFAGLVKESALLGARWETLGVVLEQLGKTAGYSKEQVLGAAYAIQDAGIEMNISRQMTARLIQAQVDLAKAHRLARIAQDAAVIGNINSTESFERLIHGLVTAQPRVLRMIGLQVDFEKAYKKTAETLNKNVEDLDALEKQQARTNEVFEKGEKIQGAYEAAMSTAGKQILSFKRYIVDTKTIIGEYFLPIVKDIVSDAKSMVFQFREWAIANQEIISESALNAWKTFRDIMEGIAKAMGLIATANNKWQKFKQWYNEKYAYPLAKFFNWDTIYWKVFMQTGSDELARKAANDYVASIGGTKGGGGRTKLTITKKRPTFYEKATNMDAWWRQEHGYGKAAPDMWQRWGTGWTTGVGTSTKAQQQAGMARINAQEAVTPWTEEIKDITKEQLDNITDVWNKFFQDLMSGNFKGLGGIGKGLLGAIAQPMASMAGSMVGKKVMDWAGKGIGGLLGVTKSTGMMVAGGVAAVGMMGIQALEQAKANKHRRHVEKRTRKTERLISQYETQTGETMGFISSIISGAFTDAIDSGDFTSFTRGLKESVYDAVKGGMIEAMLSSSVIQGIIKPFQEGFSKAFEMASEMGKIGLPYGGKYGPGGKAIDYIKSFNVNKFMAYMQPWLSSIGSLTMALQPAFSGISGALDMVGGSLGLGSESSGIQLGSTNSGMNFSMYANVATTEDASDWIAQVMEEYERKKAAKKSVNKYKDYYSVGTDTGLGP